MPASREAIFSFPKLIVADEEAMAEYYHQVYGLNKLHRVSGGENAAGGPFREIIMGPGDQMGSESLTLFRFLDRPAPRDQEAILGFIPDDLEALGARIVTHGGKYISPIRNMPEHGVRVLFATDPEGRMSENVELLQKT